MRYKLLVLLLSFATTTFAQYDSEGKNTSRFRPGTFWFYSGLGPAKPEKLHKYDRLIFDLTYNDWTGDRKPFQMKWNSIGFNTNLMFDIPMAKNNVASFGIGVCYGLQNYQHNAWVVMDSTIENSTVLADYAAQTENWSSSFTGHNISMPIEFRFRTKGWRHFKVHIGGKIGYQINTIYRTKFDDGNEKYTWKYKSLPDVNRLTYSAHVRIGIRNWALFGSYNFNTMFKSSESVQLNPFQLGISISLF